MIDIYNQAGEKVKILASTLITVEVGAVLFEQNGIETAVFDPTVGDLNINLPGVNSPSQTGGLSFAWNGKAENGAFMGIGNYYIKVSIVDSYGHEIASIKDIMIIKTEEYIRMSIFNSAGEVVYRAEKNTSFSGKAMLKTADVILVGNGAAPAEIKYTDMDYFTWDGKNLFGNLVSSGTYEVYAEVKSGNSYTFAASKTITVLNGAVGPVLGKVKCYPNPYIFESDVSGAMRVEWTGTGQGKVKVKFYNPVGDLIGRLEEDLAVGFVDWNMQTESGAKLASGYYLAVIEGVSGSGGKEHKAVKLVVLRKY